jgi:hypothetical protein
MLARRLLVLVAVLMGLTAVAAGFATRPPTRTTTQDPVSPPEPSRTASPTVERFVSVSEPTSVSVEEGSELRLTVRGDTLDVVELVGLDQLQAVAPESPAVFDLIADRPGSYPIRLTQSGERAGRLKVTPARE